MTGTRGKVGCNKCLKLKHECRCVLKEPIIRQKEYFVNSYENLSDFEKNVGKRLQTKEEYENAKKRLDELESEDWNTNPSTEQSMNIEISTLKLLISEYETRNKISRGKSS